MSVPEVEEINISCEAGMEESFPGASAPKKREILIKVEWINFFLFVLIFEVVSEYML